MYIGSHYSAVVITAAAFHPIKITLVIKKKGVSSPRYIGAASERLYSVFWIRIVAFRVAWLTAAQQWR